MKSFFVGCAVALMVGQASPAFANPTALAPADDYFGQHRMSVLGVRNAIRDLDLRENLHIYNDEAAIYGKLLIVENSLDDWRARYPNDSWIPRLGLAIAKTWMKLGYADARDHAGIALEWVIARYPNNEIAPWAAAFRNASRTLARTDRRTAIAPMIPIENP